MKLAKMTSEEHCRIRSTKLLNLLLCGRDFLILRLLEHFELSNWKMEVIKIISSELKIISLGCLGNPSIPG